jgi:hypothetical protein
MAMAMAMAIEDRRFSTVLEGRPRGGVTVRLPFDPDAAWGERPRHDVHGTIAGYRVRGPLARRDEGWALELGPTWCRDPAMRDGARVEVVLRPEPPQLATMAQDIADAIRAEPAARATFESIATHYRLNFVRWIEEAKRPDTRARRVAETVETLRAGRRDR